MIALLAEMASFWLHSLCTIFGQMVGKFTAIVAAKLSETFFWFRFEIWSLTGRQSWWVELEFKLNFYSINKFQRLHLAHKLSLLRIPYHSVCTQIRRVRPGPTIEIRPSGSHSDAQKLHVRHRQRRESRILSARWTICIDLFPFVRSRRSRSSLFRLKMKKKIINFHFLTRTSDDQVSCEPCVSSNKDNFAWYFNSPSFISIDCRKKNCSNNNGRYKNYMWTWTVRTSRFYASGRSRVENENEMISYKT